MTFICFILGLFFIIFTPDCEMLMSKLQPYYNQNKNRVCYNVTKEPSYFKSWVTGRPWHAYFTWNMQVHLDFEQLCFKTIFKVPENMGRIVRFLRDKFDGMNEEPNWKMAEMLLYMGESREMLLLKDRNGVPGQFDGIPFFHRADNPPEPPLFKPFKMTMKVFERGKYLLFSDCSSGVVFLLLHPDTRPKRVEIEAIADKFDYGNRYPACIEEPDPVIQNVTTEIPTTVATTTKKISKYDW